MERGVNVPMAFPIPRSFSSFRLDFQFEAKTNKIFRTESHRKRNKNLFDIKATFPYQPELSSASIEKAQQLFGSISHPVDAIEQRQVPQVDRFPNKNTREQTRKKTWKKRKPHEFHLFIQHFLFISDT